MLIFPAIICAAFFIIRQTGMFPVADFQASVVPLLPCGQAGRPVVVQSGSTVELRLNAKGPESILFYAKGPFINLPIYLGQGRLDENGVWKYSFNVADNVLPKGNYLIYGHISENGNVCDTGRAEMRIYFPAAGEDARKIALEENIEKNNLDIDAINTKIEENIRTAAGSILTMIIGADEAAGDVRKIADISRAIEDFNFLLGDKTMRQNEMDTNIHLLEDEISGYGEDILPLIKNDKLKMLAGLKNERAAIGREISDIGLRVDEKSREREVVKNMILAMDKEGRNNPAIKQELESLAQNVSQWEKEIIALQDVLRQDQDGDGLNNILEIKIGTDPFNCDSDSDGALDGDEAGNNRNPLNPDGFSPKEEADPRTAAPKSADIYRIAKAEAYQVSKDDIGINFEGYGLSDAYIEIYVYSVPVVSIAKADASGRWTRALDYPLSDGRHTAYAVSTDSQGKIVARSQPWVFEKNGGRITQVIFGEGALTSDSINDIKAEFKLSTTTAVILAFAFALLLIGFRARRNSRLSG